MYWRILFLLFLLAAICPAEAIANSEKYYVVVYGANNGKPKVSHTWATFIRETFASEESREKSSQVEEFTISWLPIDGVVTPRLFGGERGRNFSLEESIQWCRDYGIAVVAWGPVEIRKELFERAKARKELLDSGRLGYRMLDRLGRNTTVTNCIHAVSDIVPGPELLTGIAYGVEASALVAEHLRSYMIGPEVTHPHLLERVGLAKHAVTYRNLGR